MKSGLNVALAGILSLSFITCKHKKKEAGEKLFPVLPYLRSQVAHVDSSLYSIQKIVFIDSLRNDTIYLKREEFEDAAKDFLSLPDISASKYEDRYIEDKQYDETLNRVLIVYTPVKPDKEEIQRQEVLIKPDPEGDKITTIIINSITDKKDSLIEKKMLWNADQSFQVTTIKQFRDGPETISTYKLVWNEPEQE
jgi:hypothetical protein